MEALTISVETFGRIIGCKRALQAFDRIGIDALALAATSDIIFPLKATENEEGHSTFKHAEFVIFVRSP